MTERNMATGTHGRYLVVPPESATPVPILVGFHGYAESAETQLERLRAIPDSDRWLVVSIQGLHRFYQRRTNTVVAGWMTSQDRELAIADNIAYVKACIEALAAEWPTRAKIVFAGFSQGVAMAFRAAVHATPGLAAVISAGGDIPPEITPEELKTISRVLLARGKSDEFYTEQQFLTDEQRLRGCSVNVLPVRLDAGHEWPPDLIAVASNFLADVDR